jgi:cobalamin biosynthesis protein CbiD
VVGGSANQGVGTPPREFFVRQLRGMKASYKPKQFDATDLVEYAEACGYGLARAHAKAGDAALIAGWMGKSNKLNRALVDFARVYADVNAADWELLKAG